MVTKEEMIAANTATCSVCAMTFAPCDEVNFRDGPVKCLTCLRKAFEHLCRHGSQTRKTPWIN